MQTTHFNCAHYLFVFRRDAFREAFFDLRPEICERNVFVRVRFAVGVEER